MLPSGSRSKYVLTESHPENPSWTVMCRHLYWMELSHLLGLLFFLTFLPGEIELLGWYTQRGIHSLTFYGCATFGKKLHYQLKSQHPRRQHGDDNLNTVGLV